MNFIESKENKKQFLPLLLLADEQEEMIDKYLERGTMYVSDDNDVKCGLIRSHVVKNFFIDNYDHPIIEDGVQLVDMIYLQRRI